MWEKCPTSTLSGSISSSAKPSTLCSSKTFLTFCSPTTLVCSSLSDVGLGDKISAGAHSKYSGASLQFATLLNLTQKSF